VLPVGALEAVCALDLGVREELSIVGFNDLATLG
jgi:DNA-binding LacI/PurR family transcriptional regulator